MSDLAGKSAPDSGHLSGRAKMGEDAFLYRANDSVSRTFHAIALARWVRWIGA
jgi:hypothetical protein